MSDDFRELSGAPSTTLYVGLGNWWLWRVMNFL